MSKTHPDVCPSLPASQSPADLALTARLSVSWLHKLNYLALAHLLEDAPQRRRRLYLEYPAQQTPAIMAAMAKAGLDMASLRPVAGTAPENRCQHCLITGTAPAILQFLAASPEVTSARVDLPEYRWGHTAEADRSPL